MDNRTLEEVRDNETKLIKEIMKLEQQLKKKDEVIDKTIEYIKIYGKYYGEKCTRGFQMMTADFNKLLQIIKKAKGE